MNILLERIKSNRIDYKSLVKALLFVTAFMVFSVEINLLSNFFQMVASGKMVPTKHKTYAVDTKEDLNKVEKLMKKLNDHII